MRGPSTYAQSSAQGRRAAMELSDSEEDEVLENGGMEVEEEEDLAQWTISTFKPRPLKGENAANIIRELRTKLADPIDKAEESLSKFGEVAAAIADCDEKHPQIKQIQTQFLQVLDTRYRLKIKVDVLQKLEQELRRGGGATDDAERVYASEVSRLTDEWSAKSDRAKFKDDGFFEAFRAKIWEKTNPDVPDGPISRYLDGGDNDEDDSDDEVEAGGTIKNYQCPLSRTTLVDAQTSTKCGHSFSGQYIFSILDQNKRKGIKCPVVGCPQRLHRADVEADPATQKAADAYAKKKKQKERETAREHEDDDVVEDDDS